jgi:RNA polymerase sigma factor (sigma-70 family)
MLLDAVRRGDRDAYVELYERHVAAARALARALLRNQTDADDVVSEVFASALSVIKRGKGPRDGFRAYLMASVRNECYRTGRRNGRTSPIETDVEANALVASGRGTVEADPFARRDEVAVLQEAFQSLSPKFREVLWHTEVEGSVPRGDRGGDRLYHAGGGGAGDAGSPGARWRVPATSHPERCPGRDDAPGVCRHPAPARRSRA